MTNVLSIELMTVRRIIGLLSFGVLAILLGACSSNSASNGGAQPGSGGLTCTFVVDGITECQTYAGTNAPTSCPEGQPVSSCPTDNELACCENRSVSTSAQSFTYGYCLYQAPDSGTVDTSSEQSDCQQNGGTWIPKQ